MESGDLAGVLGVWNRTMKRDPIDAGRFARLVLADPDYWPGPDSGFFLALRGEDPVGFCRAVVRRWPNDRLGVEPDEGWVPVLAVDPGCRRAGVGAALLDTALDYFRQHQRKRVWVCGTPRSAPGALPRASMTTRTRACESCSRGSGSCWTVRFIPWVAT